ncbi:hypothetical protein CEXT_716451 [Caerostris extrusa]|uniref:Uncharacterized protein n=1 Tax=Caerostris extrusa TaxID=172846 RepID=A0AAV4MTT4_CAEEX|nr:hypothetical protein CEXT_716451 [Caerostris extrusa]
MRINDLQSTSSTNGGYLQHLMRTSGYRTVAQQWHKSITKGIVALPYSAADRLAQSSILQVAAGVCIILYARLHTLYHVSNVIEDEKIYHFIH